MAFKLYRFGPVTDGDASMKDVLGGKGAGLAEMSKLGIPVPPGFTIPCEYSVTYQKQSSQTMGVYLDGLFEEVDVHLAHLKKQFGYLPLLSVRSGARVSMPGMMDTILNVGLTSKTLPEWEKKLGERAARDSYRRLIQMFGSVALDVDMEKFEALLQEAKAKAGAKTDAELSASDLSRLITNYLDLVSHDTGEPFPDTVEAQVRGAILAVFDSWNNERAEEYRKINSIPFEWGTSATVQSMVFGNMDDASCTGVLFTRDPSNGSPGLMGEWLPNAQGEDVVAGIRTPYPLSELVAWGGLHLTSQIGEVCTKLEKHYKDVQDIEFTVQSGKLYLLQTRNAKRSALAAFKIAHDLCVEGTLSKSDALKRVTREQLFAAMSDTIDPSFTTAPHLTGIAAGGGLVTGVAVFSSDDAVNCTQPCILVTKETDPDDIAGMAKSVGILTATGGLTSHAAVVARGMNKACVVGATDLVVQNHSIAAILKGGAHFMNMIPGDKITIDGSTGRVWVKTNVPVISGGGTTEVRTLLTWAFEAEQVAERIELHGGMTDNEIIKAVAASKSSRVHIDLAALEYKREGALAQYGEQMDTLAAALAGHCTADSITIDVRPLRAYRDHFDATLDRIFGITPKITGVESLTNMLDWPYELAKRVTIVGASLSAAERKVMQDKGYTLSGTVVKTFADLAMASGSVDVSDEVIQNVFGGKEGYATALSLIEKTSGKKLTSPTKPAYWYEALKEA